MTGPIVAIPGEAVKILNVAHEHRRRGRTFAADFGEWLARLQIQEANPEWWPF